MFISGGARQGLKVGDSLAVMQQGETVSSKQTGFAITLPPTKVGTLRVTGLFGDNETNEGAIGELISGSASAAKGSTIFVAENKD